MSKELVVDGKIYLPSSALAGRFSYTKDYISKLARESKIDARRVGRQWFIDESSLQDFIDQTAEAKAKQTLGHSLRALTQSLAITFCGVTLGVAGFFAYHSENQLVPFKLANFYESTSLQESQPALINMSEIWTWLFGGTVVVENSPSTRERTIEDVNPQTIEAKIDSVTEYESVQNAVLLLSPETSTTSAKEIKESFSDEIAVTFDGPNTGIIKPVFKEKTEEAYRFLLVPVAEAKN